MSHHYSTALLYAIFVILGLVIVQNLILNQYYVDQILIIWYTYNG